MQGQELLNQIYYSYRGKGQSRVPVWGSEKANTAIAIANRKQKEWARDPYHRWGSLFEVRSVGTIDTSTFEYDMDTDLIDNSDYIFINRVDGSRSEYPVVMPEKRELYPQGFYLSGRNPKKLNWCGTTIDTALDNGTIKLAGYYLPTDIALVDDYVSVDDPNWLVYATAAELARNDPAKDDEYGNLQGMANDLYTKMIVADSFTGYLQPNAIEYNMPPIGGMGGDDWTS